MEIKGTAVKSIPEFVKIKHPDLYKKWYESLPEESKEIFNNGVITANWYCVKKAAIIPTAKVGEIIYNNPNKGAWESGRFSAAQALNGIYKLYVKFSSPGHIMDRTSRIFSAYYQGTTMNVIEKSAKSVSVEISKFDNPHEIIEHRIGGWMEKALEISGCNDLKVEIITSLTKGDKSTVYKMVWN